MQNLINNQTPMNNSTKILESSIKNLKEITNLSIEDMILELLEIFMKADRESYLKENIDNKSNGYYNRLLQSFSRNNLSISVPRTRLAGFKPLLIEIIKKNEEDVKSLALDLYTHGLSSRDTEEVLNRYFSKNISHTTIVELTDKYRDERIKWEGKAIESKYKVIYIDAMYFPLKRFDTYSHEAINIAVGVREDNKREILYFNIVPHESSSNWEEIFIILKEKGLKDVSLVVADGLTGLDKAVQSQLPNALFQQCTVHKKRRVLNKVRKEHKEEVAIDLKHVFALFSKHDDENEGIKRLDKFIDKWKKTYPYIGRHFIDRKYLFTYTKFNPEIRKYIYTTNSIENINSVLRKSMRNKYSFKNEENMLNYIFAVLMDFQENNLAKYKVNHFTNFYKLTAQTQSS